MARHVPGRWAAALLALIVMIGLGVTVAPTPVARAADTPPVSSMFPTNVRATPLPGGARVSWDPVTVVGRVDLYGGFGGASVATRYFVTSSYDPATNSGYRTCVAVVPETSCVITGLTNGVAYTFQVKTDTRMVSHDSPNFTGENRQWSNYSPATAPVTPCCGIPTAVAGVSAAVVGDAVEVSWTPPSNWGGATSLTYVVSSGNGTQRCTTEATSCRLNDLPFQSSESFDVVASNAGGASPATRSAPVSIPAQAPQAPTAGTARYSRSGQATVQWKAPTRDGGSPITEYVVTSTPGGRSCTATASTRCTISGLTGGRSYTFSVRARNQLGLSPASAPIVAGRLVTAASEPRNVTADPATTSVMLSWTKPATSGGGRLLRYVVEDGSRVACQTSGTTCKVSGLNPGTEHRFRVYAVNTSGQGRPALVTTRTTVPVITPPAPPVQPGPPPAAPKPEQEFS